MADPGSKDDAKGTVVAQGTTIVESIPEEQESSQIDEAYLRSSWSTKFYRGVLFQMILFGTLSLVGPSMSDAISNLGGGGLSSPYLANLANSLGYASSCLITLFGGPLINKIGIKYSCIIAAITMPLDGSSYYLLDGELTSKILGGFTGGFLYVAETTAMLSYPYQDERGLYLGVWSAMRNSGSIIGGAINFATNYSKSTAGGIAWSTYLIFVGFVWAAILSPTKRVRRRDGSKIPSSDDITWKKEFAALWQHLQRKKTWLVFIPAFYSFFYGGTMGTYLSLHFSVRARALSSLITPIIVVPMVISYGWLLDMKKWSQRQRAWIAFIIWLIPQIGCFIWIGIEYSKFGTAKTALDYQTDVRRWAEAYLPYLIIFTTGYLTQLSLYWILGTFSTDVKSSSRTGGLFRAFETAGQAVSYAINSHSGDARIPFYVNCVVLVLAMPCMIALIRMVPETPAETDIDAGEAALIVAVAQTEQSRSM
ncbi:hypothetical protein BP6252_10450 [Coleophoma cylindrospora]|uniref:Major facilitator superfamily (MFS) profile domain-containing protein n=1 Tax=Coleophoma cylindrospora TaxID=1849047 RepID=A0A3D8QSK7_9HELO|nr:hypothetical protein BP6252_10450 [Coleophoma cylindrospora]